MTQQETAQARADIEATDDLLARALKLSGLLTTLFRQQGISLVLTGDCALDFYTEGGNLKDTIRLCRRSLRFLTPRQIRDMFIRLGGCRVGGWWKLCGFFLDIGEIIEYESAIDFKILETPFGKIYIVPAELLLVEKLVYAFDFEESELSAKQIMASALIDDDFDWQEAERLADLPDFNVLRELRSLREEMTRR